MSQTKITGLSSEIYWALESSYKNGGTGMPVTGTATHQPFNPIEGKINLPYPTYEDELVTTQESLDPNILLSYTKEWKPGEGQFPNDKGMIYHDPLLMVALVFTHKTTSGDWAGGAGTYGKITGDFTLYDDVDSIMIQYKKVDDNGNTQFSKTLNGVTSSEFRIGFETGGVLRSKYQLNCVKVQNNTQAFSADGDFDDGRWADWAKSTFYPASGCRVYWDASHAAELVDFDIKSAWFIIKTPVAPWVEASSLEGLFNVHGKREFSAEIKGNVKGDTELDELDSILGSRTKKDLRLAWDITANELKFIDFTNAHVSRIDSRSIPGAAENYEATLTYKATTADFEGNYNNLPDPSGRITT